jgi:phosphoglycerate dehydrogenase-like enzyme
MKRFDVMAELKEKSIPFKVTEKTEDLIAKLPQNESVEVEKVGPDSIDVHNHEGEYIRTYSKAQHGDTFVELATEYVTNLKREGYSLRDGKG